MSAKRFSAKYSDSFVDFGQKTEVGNVENYAI